MLSAVLCICRSPVKAPRGGSTSGVKRKRPPPNENKASGKRANPAENGIKKKHAKKKAKKGERATPLRAMYCSNYSCASCRAAAHMLNRSSSLFCLQCSKRQQSRGWRHPLHVHHGRLRGVQTAAK